MISLEGIIYGHYNDNYQKPKFFKFFFKTGPRLTSRLTIQLVTCQEYRETYLPFKIGLIDLAGLLTFKSH